MNTKELEAKRDILLRELAAYIPLWDEEQSGLLRMVAMKLVRQSGVEIEELKDVGLVVNFNSYTKSAITLGYALRIYDERNNIHRGQALQADQSAGLPTFFTNAQVVKAA